MKMQSWIGCVGTAMLLSHGLGCGHPRGQTKPQAPLPVLHSEQSSSRSEWRSMPIAANTPSQPFVDVAAQTSETETVEEDPKQIVQAPVMPSTQINSPYHIRKITPLPPRAEPVVMAKTEMPPEIEPHMEQSVVQAEQRASPQQSVQPVTATTTKQTEPTAMVYSHDKDFRTITGELQYLHTRKTWRVRFGSHEQEMVYGGSVTLVGMDHLFDQFQSGQRVKISGKLLNSDTRQTAPEYLVEEIQVIR